ncbi:sperm acrosome-associated protein 7 [Ochotona princeps]|uniref:sperm acrosome-associated protein 7 n=1 Tax=Ochotona princeps TaxID=9978 RepID=UPI0027155AF9|nr:sperm acrosome-associated protein 7 [Ochotona princeps]
MMMTWLGTLRIVFLLYCWRNADLQPFNTTSDSAVEEGSQADASETYHELLEHLQFSTGSEDKTPSNEVSTDESAHTGVTAESYHEPQLSSTEKKNSKDDPYYKLSDLDKILHNTGRSPGNTFQ